MSESAFDVMVHLIGGQGLPAVLAIKSIPAKRHVLVATEDSKASAERLKTQYEREGMAFDIVMVKPFDFGQLRKAFAALLETYRGQRVAADITGGTKPMSLMLAETWKSERLFYVETDVRQAIIDLSSPETIAFVREMKSVEEFVRIHSSAPFQPGRTEVTQGEGRLAKALLPFRKILGDQYTPLDNVLKRKQYNQLALRNEVENVVRALGDLQCSHSIRVMCDTVGAEQTCQFLHGGWLEVYPFLCLKDLPGFYDFRLNASVLYQKRDDDPDRSPRFREFDVAFTDGIHFYVVECKSGRVEQDHVNKVSGNARNFGGTYGRGVLVCTKERLGHSQEGYNNLCTQIDNAKNLMLVELPERNMAETLRTAIRNWKPGKWEVKA